MALLMFTIDSSIISSALPAIHRSLHSSLNWIGWTITIYVLGVIITLPIAGKFSDQYGRRRVFLIGVSVFTFASLLCALADNIYLLIVFRGLQALGGGTLFPSATGLVADHFGKDRDRAISMFGTFSASGQIVGPVVGSIIVTYLSWRWIFLVNIPVGVTLISLVVKFIPKSVSRGTKPSDVPGVALLATFMFSLIFAITNLGDKHTAPYDPIVLGPIVSACIFGFLFLRHANRAAAPVIPMRLLIGKGFAAVNSVNFLNGVVTFGVASLMALYAEERYHFRALDAGTLLTARAIGMIVISSVASFTLRRTGFRAPLMVGFTLIALGIFMLSVSPRWGISTYGWLCIGAAISGIGNGTIGPATRNAILFLAPDDVAAISGIRQMFTQTGVLMTVSITTAILNRSTDPGLAEAHIDWVLIAIIFVFALPLVSKIAEHKGGW